MKKFLTGSRQPSIELPRREFLRATAAGLVVTGFCRASVGAAVAGEDAKPKPANCVAQSLRRLRFLTHNAINPTRAT